MLKLDGDPVERHPLFVTWKTVVFLKLIYSFNTLIMSPMPLCFAEMEKQILKYMWNYNGL